MKIKNNDKITLPEHAGDEELIAYLDRQIDGKSRESIGIHLEGCRECSLRLNAFQRDIENFLEMRRENLLPKEMPPSGPELELFRERLAARRRSAAARRSYPRFKIPGLKNLLQNFPVILRFSGSGQRTPPRLSGPVKALKKPASEPEVFFGNRINSPSRKRQAAGIVLIVLTIFLAGVLSVNLFRNQNSPELVKQNAEPEVKSPIARIEISSQPSAAENFSQPQKMDAQDIKTRNPVKRISFKSGPPEPRKVPGKRSFVKYQTQPESKAAGDFYNLTFAGGTQEPAEDDQLIRAELSRASLLAIGVNPPVENGTDKFKIDLLIGSDGVVRAVRFVK